MSILLRDDSTQFVVQPYRELLTYRTGNLLKREVRILAEQNGMFARLFRVDRTHFEVVFSRDAGYLLAETIWNHLGKPADMLYCEALPDGKSALVIIVRAGTILFDAKLALINLVDELSALLAIETKFSVYVCGNLPISQEVEEGKLAIPSENRISYIELDIPLFTHIATDNKLALLPIEQALDEQKLGVGRYWIGGLAAAAILGLGIHFYHQVNQSPLQVNQALQVPQGYNQYLSLLNSPSPAAELSAIATQIIDSYALPGWVATDVTLGNNNDITLVVHSLGGTVTSLLDWANSRNMQVGFSPDGAFLEAMPSITSRSKPTSITALNPVIARVVDNMMQVLPGNSVAIHSSQQMGFYNSTTMIITLNQVSPNVLPLIGNAVNGLPVTLDKVDVQLQNGLLAGSIQLTALGN